MNTESTMNYPKQNWEDNTEYAEITCLHRGGYASIYRAKKYGRFFILKALNDPQNSSLLSILKREYEISIGLTHPHIVSTVLFEKQSPVGPCIVMEYVDGVSLQDYLASNPSTSERRKILAQLLSAVDYLHSKGVIHNDLKPSNMMVSSRDGQLKLIDFGLSDDDSHYLLKTLGCTPDFASPELLKNERSTDARGDVYSLGKIISCLLPGKYSRIVRKCLNDNRENRYSNVSDLQQALRVCDRIWVIPVAVMLLLVILGAVLWMFLDKMEEKREKEAYQKQTEWIDEAFSAAFTSAKDSILNHDLEQSNIYVEAFTSYCVNACDSALRQIPSDAAQSDLTTYGLALCSQLTDNLTHVVDSIVQDREQEYKRLCELFASKLNERAADMLKSIPSSVYKVYALPCLHNWALCFNALRDSCVNAAEESRKGEMYAYGETLWLPSYNRISAAVEALPDFPESLSIEERQYHCDRVMNGLPYRPYRR